FSARCNHIHFRRWHHWYRTSFGDRCDGWKNRRRIHEGKGGSSGSYRCLWNYLGILFRHFQGSVRPICTSIASVITPNQNLEICITGTDGSFEHFHASSSAVGNGNPITQGSMIFHDYRESTAAPNPMK